MRMSQMIKFLVLVVAIGVLPVMGGESPQEIYLLIGQSNMAGRAQVTPEIAGPLDVNDAVTRTKAAVDAGGELKGILWHQGESNANDPEYVQKASALIAALRKALGDNDLPFVVGETCTAQLKRPVNKLLNEIPNVLPNTACVSAAGLTAHDVTTHFDTESQLELGRCYAVAILKLLD